MTKLPGKPALPMTPTQDENGAPTTCICCGRLAIGIGRAVKERGKVIDNGFLCKQCIVAVEDLSKMDRLSHYELRALDAGVDAVGEYIAEHGITDLRYFDELMQRMMVKAAITGFAQGVREALKEAPF